MPKNSFLIEDILNLQQQQKQQQKEGDFKGFKKRALNSHQFESVSSSPTSSSSSSGTDDGGSQAKCARYTASPSEVPSASSTGVDYELLKHHYLKQTFPALFFNYGLNYHGHGEGFNNENLMALFGAYGATTDEHNNGQIHHHHHQQQPQHQQSSLFNSYYSRLFQAYARPTSLLPKAEAAEIIDRQLHALNSKDHLLHINNNHQLKKQQTTLVDDTSTDTSSNSSSSLNSNISPKSTGDENENVSPLDALLQLANSTFVSRAAAGFIPGTNSATGVDDCVLSKKFNLSTFSNEDCSNLGNNNDILEKRKSNPNSNNTSFESLSNKTTPASHNHHHIHHRYSSGLLNGHVNNNGNSTNTTPTTTSTTTTTTNTSTTSVNNLLKRKRKNRTAFTANQIFELEKRFSNQRYLSPHDRDRIAHELSLSTAQVITWFQNRRAKQKRDIEELKNDVNAAKSLRVIDPEIDVEKMIKCETINAKYAHHYPHQHNAFMPQQFVVGGSQNDFIYDNEPDNSDDDDDENQIDIDNEDDSNLSSSVNNNDLNTSVDNSISSSKVNSND